MDSVLHMNGVSKTYRGKRALRNVSLELGAGKITGLLGSNGSGKSTLMKLAAGLLHADEGGITVQGVPVGEGTKGLVSFMPDRPLTESWMTVGEAIAFMSDFYPDFDEHKAAQMLDFMRLGRKERVGTLSKGMNERLQLTLALSRRAGLYMLDEPIGGVDPVARERILDALVQFYEEDSTVLISTHLVNDIERIFDDVIFLKQGEIMMHSEVEDVRLKTGKSVNELFKEVYAEC